MKSIHTNLSNFLRAISIITIHFFLKINEKNSSSHFWHYQAQAFLYSIFSHELEFLDISSNSCQNEERSERYFCLCLSGLSVFLLSGTDPRLREFDHYDLKGTDSRSRLKIDDDQKSLQSMIKGSWNTFQYRAPTAKNIDAVE